MSISREFAKLTLQVKYDRLPPEVTREAKRLILDSLACAVGAFQSEPATICRELALELGGAPEATILGERHRVGCSAAVLANAVMIRYLDYNDSLDVSKGPADLAGTHPSDALPAALAVGERVGASGKELIEAVVVGYEIVGRMADSFATSLEVLGFHHGSIIPYVSAAMAGKLLRLTEEQIVHALGIAGAAAIGLDILDADGEVYNMTKNIANGLLSERGVLAALLARRNFTGPERIIEGNKGFAEVVLRGRENYVSRPERDRFWILDTAMKSIPSELTTHGHLSATAELVQQHKFRPEEIAEICIRTNKRTVVHTGDPVKKFPTNKETADHSSFFLTAIAVVDGKVTPAAYSPRRYADPVIHSLMERVRLEHDPQFDLRIPTASVTISTTDGRTYAKQVDHPKGHPRNRMTDDEIRSKFLECAENLMPESQVDHIVEMVMNLERLENIGTLMPQLIVRA